MALGDNLGDKFPDYGLLLIEEGAIDSVGLSDGYYYWLPEEVANADGILKYLFLLYLVFHMS